MRYFTVGTGFDLPQMQAELREYTDILLGRTPPPIDHGVMTLMELAEAFHARASEMEMELLQAEAEGQVLKGTRPYRFRTGMLRTFIEMCKRTTELGSRRLTYNIAQAEGKL